MIVNSFEKRPLLTRNASRPINRTTVVPSILLQNIFLHSISFMYPELPELVKWLQTMFAGSQMFSSHNASLGNGILRCSCRIFLPRFGCHSIRSVSLKFELSSTNVWNMFEKLSLLSPNILDNTILLACFFGVENANTSFFLPYFSKHVSVCYRAESIHVTFNLSGKWVKMFAFLRLKDWKRNDKLGTAISIYIIAVPHTTHFAPIWLQKMFK